MSISTLVVPCFNEETRLDRDAFVGFAREHPSIRFVFVNDGSRDGTGEVLEHIRAAAPDRAQVLDLPTNVGKAEAVRRGMLHALDRRPTFVGFWDADLATPLAEVFAFIDLLERRPELEMVFGSRVRLLGRTIERRAFRHYVGRGFATAASLALRLPVYDTQCGAKLFRASQRLRQVFETPFLARWIFDVEIIARFGSAPPPYAPAYLVTAISEHPLREWRDRSGSKRQAGDLARAAVDLARVYLAYLRA
ncbi:MAG TPA: glycosyltransferase [Gemmatimonadaceae bacterium]|nr:glycosyltransferase [Gemmatimonadaceae bacterium]